MLTLSGRTPDRNNRCGTRRVGVSFYQSGTASHPFSYKSATFPFTEIHIRVAKKGWNFRCAGTTSPGSIGPAWKPCKPNQSKGSPYDDIVSENQTFRSRA